MAFIEGLKERKDALDRIKVNLKEIKAIDKNISFLKASNLSNAERDVKLDCKYRLAGGHEVKFKIPVDSGDEFVLNTLKQQKVKLVAAIKDDVNNYRISLEQSEEEMLFIDD